MGGVASTLVGKEKLNIGAGRGVASKGEEERVTTSRASPFFVCTKALDIGAACKKRLTLVGLQTKQNNPPPKAVDIGGIFQKGC